MRITIPHWISAGFWVWSHWAPQALPTKGREPEGGHGPGRIKIASGLKQVGRWTTRQMLCDDIPIGAGYKYMGVPPSCIPGGDQPGRRNDVPTKRIKAGWPLVPPYDLSLSRPR